VNKDACGVQLEIIGQRLLVSYRSSFR